MKIAITGNSGFIGSALMRHFASNQSLTLFPFDKTKHSLASINSLKSFVENKDIIIHLAGITSPAFSEECYVINTLGTLNLLQAALLYGKPNIQFIFSSSFAVYEETKINEKLNEDKTRILPRNHYGITKQMAEELVTYYNRSANLSTRILRIANPYGPNYHSKYNGVIAILIDKISHGEPIVIDGDGSQSRDFIFINDIADAFTNVLTYGGGNLIVNICSGQNTQIITLVKKIELLIGKKAIIRYNKRYTEKGYWIGDPKKAKKTIDFSIKTNIDDGLQQTIAWHFKNVKR